MIRERVMAGLDRAPCYLVGHRNALTTTPRCTRHLRGQADLRDMGRGKRLARTS